jgi:hypothetical protein
MSCNLTYQGLALPAGRQAENRFGALRPIAAKTSIERPCNSLKIRGRFATIEVMQNQVFFAQPFEIAVVPMCHSVGQRMARGELRSLRSTPARLCMDFDR